MPRACENCQLFTSANLTTVKHSPMVASMSTYTVVIPVANDLPARTLVSVTVTAATRQRAARAAVREARARGFGIGPSELAARTVTRARR